MKTHDFWYDLPEELIAQNRAALAEHVAHAMAAAEELGRLTRRQERQAGTID